jgi:hypothetical protein
VTANSVVGTILRSEDVPLAPETGNGEMGQG